MNIDEKEKEFLVELLNQEHDFKEELKRRKLLAEKLLEKEVIFKTDLEIIFGKRAFENEYAELITEDVTDEIPQETNIENSVETQE